MEPEKIGRFRIVRRLGAGGMGVVYEGIDDMLGRRAAIKVLREETARDATGRRRFLREARAAAAVSEHDNVGTIYEVGEDGETLYLAMEYVEGGHCARSSRTIRPTSSARWRSSPTSPRRSPRRTMRAWSTAT